ncbi:MAG: hypothetical protein VX589_04460 [Myxococcota bacterium]|nr:hypothetical protein [Myxococcota bacterium]
MNDHLQKNDALWTMTHRTRSSTSGTVPGRIRLVMLVCGLVLGCGSNSSTADDDVSNSQLLAEGALGGIPAMPGGIDERAPTPSPGTGLIPVGGTNTFVLTPQGGGVPDADTSPSDDELSDDTADGEDAIQRVRWDDVNVTLGYTEKIALELPDDVQSVTLVATGETRFLITVEHFEGPQGEILVAENPPGVRINNRDRQVTPFPGPFLSPNRSASAGTGIGTLLAPNNPGVNVYGGTWQFSIGVLGLFGRSDANIDIEAIIKRAPQAQVRGTLDLHFYFTGARGWTAETAPTDRDFLAAVDRMREFYQPIGIELGDFTYTNISNEFREVDAGPMGPGANMSKIQQMFALNTKEDGLGIFFVDRIESGQVGGFIGGLSGGTPGPSMTGGTTRSGIAVATLMAPRPSEIGHIMGHEAGHFLGLYHTQEFIGYTDMIDDTAQSFAGADNLMFPTVTSEPASLSDGQAWVLHRSPIIKPVEDRP